MTTISKIKASDKVEDVPSDVLRQELATQGNTLSFWKCESLKDTKDTIKAILLSATSIEKSQFIIFDDVLLDRYEIIRDCNEDGKTGYYGFSNLHVNLCELNYGKIGNLLSCIKEIYTDKEYVPELSKNEVKEYIKEVCRDSLIDYDHIDKHLLSDIEKYELDKV